MKSQPGWKPDPSVKDGRPTRRQRSEYIFKKKSVEREARTAYDRISAGLDLLAGDLYARASKTTHLAGGERKDLETLVGYLRSLLRDLLLH